MNVKITTSADSFAEYRQGNNYYIDKTSFLEPFLELGEAVTLFTRPRRFGKTMFMSMLAEFFDLTKKSQKLFKGLKVSDNKKLCTKWRNKYPVIFLTLKNINKPSYERALSDIQVLICKFCQQYRHLLLSESVDADDKEDLQQYLDRRADEDTLERSLEVLVRALSCHYKKPTIVLIDEYDVPVAKAEDHSYGEEMLRFMGGFLGRALKSNFKHLQFAILTGCLRITKESFYTGLNNLKCYDIMSNSRYEELFGFTQGEVDQLLADAGLMDMQETIREWYDGYCFGDRTDLYCPWSIMQYLNDLAGKSTKEPEAYWVNTASNTLPKSFVSRLSETENVQEKIVRLLGGDSISVPINRLMTYADIFKETKNFWSLLYLTGYLTLARNPGSYTGIKNADDSLLVIPNKEIQKVFQKEVESWFTKLLSKQESEELYAAFWNQDVQACQESLATLLVRSSCRDDLEAFYHGMMFLLFAIRYKGTTSNGEAGRGFFDLVVPDTANSRAAVLEIKRAPSENQLDTMVLNALEQIAKKQYDIRLRSDGYRTIIHVGMAFCGKVGKVAFHAVDTQEAARSRTV